MPLQWNPNFSNLQGKQKLVRKIEGVKFQCSTKERERLLVRVIGRFEKSGFEKSGFYCILISRVVKFYPRGNACSFINLSASGANIDIRSLNVNSDNNSQEAILILFC